MVNLKCCMCKRIIIDFELKNTKGTFTSIAKETDSTHYLYFVCNECIDVMKRYTAEIQKSIDDLAKNNANSLAELRKNSLTIITDRNERSNNANADSGDFEEK